MIPVRIECKWGPVPYGDSVDWDVCGSCISRIAPGSEQTAKSAAEVVIKRIKEIFLT